MAAKAMNNYFDITGFKAVATDPTSENLYRIDVIGKYPDDI